MTVTRISHWQDDENPEITTLTVANRDELTKLIEKDLVALAIEIHKSDGSTPVLFTDERDDTRWISYEPGDGGIYTQIEYTLEPPK